MKSWRVTVKKAVNHKPTLTIKQNPPTTVNIGEYVTLKLSAYDSDRDLKEIDVDWEGNGRNVEGKTASNNQVITFSRKFTRAGTYTITATAYDRDTSVKSSMKSWRVTVKKDEVVDKPTVVSISPLTATQNQTQNYTIKGTNLPNTIIGNIEGSRSHCSLVSHSSSVVVMSCKAEALGKKRFYLKDKSGGTAISGSESIKITVSEVTTTDTKPTITIKTPVSINGSTLTATILSTDDNNLEKVFFSIFDSNNNKIDIQNSVSVIQPSLVAYTGDITLVASINNSQQFNDSLNSVRSYSYGYTPNSKTETTSWIIDTSNLSNSTYTIKFYADDGSEIAETENIPFTTSSTLVNGICGTANNHIYKSTDTSFGEYTLCSSGKPVGANESSPVFPSLGGTIQWACVGDVEGTSEICSASRKSNSPTLKPKLSLIQDINFGRSKNRSLNVAIKASIKLKIENIVKSTEIQVNFDGIGKPEVTKTVSSSGVYEFSYLFKKSDYSSDSSDFWKKNLILTATAYNANGASNVIKNRLFTIYDLDEYHKYLARVKAQKLLEEKKKKEEERARLEAEREAQLEDKQQVIQNIEDIADRYSDRAKEDLDTIKNIDSQEDCAWLNRDGNCIPIYKDKNGEYSYSEKYEESKYSYTIKVKYYKYTSSYFPANVRLESNNLVMYSDKLAQNPKHLQILVAQLIEQYKNRIDSQEALVDLPLDTEEYSFLLDNQEGETRTGAGFVDPVGNKEIKLDIPLDEEKKNRVINAFTKAWESWSHEIYDSAVKAQGSLSLVFDSDTSGLEKAENVSRATYQVSLGALKAIYGAFGGFIYGAGENEINTALNSIKGYTQEQFEKLSKEQQAIILDKIHSSIEYINADPERKATFETITIALGSKIRGLKNVTKEAKTALKIGKTTKSQLIRNTIRITKTTTVRSIKSFKKQLLSGKLNKIIPTSKGFISKSKILAMDTFALTKKKYQKLLDKLVKNGDPNGDLIENIAKLYFKEHFKEFKLYDGMYSGNKGFDMVYIKGSIDNIQDIIIVEAKQISKGGSSNFTYNKGVKVTQFTDEWIELTAKKLSSLGGDKAKFADYIIKNPKKIKKLFVSVDKNPKSVNYKRLIMGEITFK